MHVYVPLLQKLYSDLILIEYNIGWVYKDVRPKGVM